MKIWWNTKTNEIYGWKASENCIPMNTKNEKDCKFLIEMSAFKDDVIQWIENMDIDYYTEFMNSMEKVYPKLHEKLLEAIWKYAKIQIVDKYANQVEI